MTIRIAVLFAASVLSAIASDFTGIYARIDKVVLEPNADAPQAIQIWGVFSLAKPNDRNEYLPPVRGYLYMKLNESKDAALREWADMKQVAGTGEVVSFAARHQLKATVRKASEPAADPDPYPIAFGLSKHRHRTDYPPVRRLLDYKD
jgi:hypothetical protein